MLGNVLPVLASAGPCYFEEFFGDATFRPLMDRLAAIGDLNALPLQAYLLSARGVESIGAGISAMPSVHVAMTTLLVLMMHDRFGRRSAACLDCAARLLDARFTISAASF